MKLLWDDAKDKKYVLGELYKEGDYYYFNINNIGLKEAMLHGCFGIGNIDISKSSHKSKELFYFFKRRIPPHDSENIKEILEQFGIKEYDEMKLLEKTQGRLLTDRYYIEM